MLPELPQRGGREQVVGEVVPELVGEVEGAATISAVTDAWEAPEIAIRFPKYTFE